jgi:hypothetical protein
MKVMAQKGLGLRTRMMNASFFNIVPHKKYTGVRFEVQGAMV